MGDYFDDDDLINEYMEEDFEPPDYDEAFLEAEFAAADNINDAAAPEPMPQEPPWNNPENETLEENLAVPVATVTIQPPEKKVDAYSFERYLNHAVHEGFVALSLVISTSLTKTLTCSCQVSRKLEKRTRDRQVYSQGVEKG